MANYTPYGIYTYVRGKVLEAFPTIYVTGGEEPIPPKGWAVQIREVSHSRPIRNVCLNGEDEQWRVAFDANVYSNLFNGGYDDVYKVMRVIEQAFRELYFIEFECLPVERANDRVSRLVARFERVIGSGDQMPTGATGATGATGST